MPTVLVLATFLDAVPTRPTLELLTLARRVGDPVVVVLEEVGPQAADVLAGSRDQGERPHRRPDQADEVGAVAQRGVERAVAGGGEGGVVRHRVGRTNLGREQRGDGGEREQGGAEALPDVAGPHPGTLTRDERHGTP